MRAVLDEALLDDAGRLLDADRAGVLRAAATAGAQVRATWAAAQEAGAGADGDDFAFLRLFLGGVGDDDAALGLLFALDATNDHPVVQRTEFHA